MLGERPRTIDTVLVTLPYPEPYLGKLDQIFRPAQCIHLAPSDSVGIGQALHRADVALIQAEPDPRFLTAPNLAWVHCDSAGLERWARPEVLDSGLVVTGSAGRSAPALAQHAMFFALALTYGGTDLAVNQHARSWSGMRAQLSPAALWGKTMGIVGLGHTGIDLIPLAKAFGMRVIAYRRRTGPAPSGVDRVYSADAGDRIDEVLRRSDVLVLAVGLNDRTHHLIGRRELSLMRPTAYLINLARGSVVDETALVEALRHDRIAGAGLDVFETEPLPPDAALWDAPHVVITPHATPPLPDRLDRVLATIEENAQRFRAGEPMLNQLQRDDIYRQPRPSS